MGNSSSASAPLLGNAAAAADITAPGVQAGFDAYDEDGALVCAICIGSLDRAATFKLPGCGHTFHSLCIASVLQASQYCPLCRCSVDEQVCSTICNRILCDPDNAGSSLAEELLLGIRSKKSQKPEAKPNAEDTARAIHLAAQRGDVSKIPAIAALLACGKGGAGKPLQPPAVRLEAVRALRALVPVFPSTWDGLPHVLELLQGVLVAKDGHHDEVRREAAKSLKEVGRRGDEPILSALRSALADGGASVELRLQAADAVQALGVPYDKCSMRTSLVALADADCSVRSAGLNTLKSICGPRGQCAEFIADLAELVSGHQDPEVRAAAVELLAYAEAAGGPYGIGVARASLQDPSEEVMRAGLATLRQLWQHGDPDATASLSALVMPGQSRARDPMLRCAAVEALLLKAERGNVTALTAAATALDDEDPSVRGAAVQALKQLSVRGDVEVTALLLHFVDHPDVEVRRLVIEVLGHTASKGDAQVMAKLSKMQASDDLDVQHAAEQALLQLR